MLYLFINIYYRYALGATSKKIVENPNAEVNHLYGLQEPSRILTFVGKGDVPKTLTLRVEVVKQSRVKDKLVERRKKEGFVEAKNSRSTCVYVKDKDRIRIDLNSMGCLKPRPFVQKKRFIVVLLAATDNYITFPVEKIPGLGKQNMAIVEATLDAAPKKTLHTAYFSPEPFFLGTAWSHTTHRGMFLSFN